MDRIIRSFLITCFLFISFSVSIFAYTVDDVRDLLGQERVDETFTESEISLIITQYEKIERANLYVKLFDIGKDIDINSDLVASYQKLEFELSSASDSFSLNFQSGEPLDVVLKSKSKLDSILHKINSLRDLGYEVNVEYIPNIWEEKYKKVQSVVSNLSEQYIIGDVGDSMRIPLNNDFIITSPYGLRLNPFTKDSVNMHNGIDFAASSDTFVFSQWNGVVSKIYESASGGKTIEILHGNDLKTIYMHLNSFKVEVGAEVKQYQLIGLSGNTGNSTGPHLHFGVYLDGVSINPIYLYGTKGLQSFKTYISSNPERNLEISEIEKLLKDKPSKTIINDITIEPTTNLILDVKTDSFFNKSSFFDTIYPTVELGSDAQNTDDEINKQKEDALKELLGE